MRPKDIEEIKRLKGIGLSKREIASQLFVPLKAVENIISKPSAFLISAAPDMLRALEAIEGALDNLPKERALVKSAIAKAKGGLNE